MNHIRRAALAIVSLGALALSGCGDSDRVDAENESIESVAAKVAKSDVRPQAGRWESKVTFNKMEMPGLPPEAKEMMQKQMGATQNFVTCLTPEEAAKPEGDFFQPGASGCTYDHFNMGGGTIDAKMTCEEDGTSQVMTMSGQYATDSYNITINADGNAQGMPMSMAMTVASQRVGECTGDENS